MADITIDVQDTPPPWWDAFAGEHPAGTIYHLSGWNEVVRASLGREVRYVSVHADGRPCGALPLTGFRSLLFGRFAVSLPFINYGGPLTTDDSALPPLVDHLSTVVRDEKLDFVELRCTSSLPVDLPVKQHKVTFHLALPDTPEDLAASFKSKLRSQIRRAEKERMTTRTGGAELLPDFYRVFARNMRDLGTPVLPAAFFRNILDAFPEHAFLVVVYTQQGDAAASSFLLKHASTMEIPWASSLAEFNRFSPNMLLYRESMQLAIAKGCSRFDFGRCSPDGGTYRFKKQWGGTESPLHWYYVLPEGEALPEINPNNPKFRLMVWTWQRMPVFAANLLGPRLIRHIP